MFITLEETIELINKGKTLHIAGDEGLLDKLPRGNWIGGTTPYFISEEGGVFSKERLFVNEIDYGQETRIASYGKYNVFQIVEECYDNGLTMLLMPYGSDVARKYAKEAPEVDELLMHPVIGWITGMDLELGGQVQARVYDGTVGESYTDRAVVMYIRLPEGKSAMVNMINIFTDDKNDPVIRFFDNDLSVTKCTVDGVETNFAEYIGQKGLDPRMPLVADYNGSYINTSIMGVENGAVGFYAPVFKNIDYRFATKVSDYAGEFKKRVDEAQAKSPVFTCNCILNFNYGELNGKKLSPYVGPVTFGEVAYQLLNQTLVYCEILG
ncbi:MAG: hypothetical protein K6B14_10830 [Lachnospiraceae bacterium]|nr:hypothetical protein [Lachnospiraceae bacterium]